MTANISLSKKRIIEKCEKAPRRNARKDGRKYDDSIYKNKYTDTYTFYLSKS